MPTTWPSRSTSGPPELPWLIGASIWMKSSYGPLCRSRPRAETMPAVTVVPMPKGLPIARISPGDGRQGLRGLDLDHGQIGLGVGADQLAGQFRAVVERYLDIGGVGDDVVVGDDVAVRA